ncbi:hypothetical protein [Acinetobacter variabilis]|uniref:hypothetical protein n=1 Tax=Acinetobacter variabilis TaxID=70346 RepID=UPI0021CE741D|nr:hypothetical protein [Acinetobacter variabilis]
MNEYTQNLLKQHKDRDDKLQDFAMNKYTEMLHEIEAKKQQLEQRIAAAVQAEISQWQQENNLPIREVYIDLEDVSTMGEPKRYEVSRASVDIDYRP